MGHVKTAGKKGNLKRILRRDTQFAVAMLACVSLMSLLATSGRWFEIMTHFKALYLGFAMMGALACALLKSPRWAGVALTTAAFHAWGVIPWYVPIHDDAIAEPNLRLIVSNVMTSNERYDDFIEMARKSDADVLIVQELNDAWVAALEPLKDAYPHVYNLPREDNFGVGIYSRLPLLNARINDLASSGVSGLSADINVNGRTVTLLNYHTLPPVTNELYETRNQQLDALAPFVKEQDDLVIVAGDLNTAMWSPYYLSMERETDLRNARKGFGILPTWPTGFPFLKIPIDHCLVSREIQVLSLQTGPKFGSDHLPLAIALFVPPAP